MKIAVDGMGGDYAPEDVVTACVNGSREYGVEIALVGPQERMEAELAKHDLSGTSIEIVHAAQHLVEGENPAYALRTKRDASIVVATKLVRDGKADAVISAGPTGGVMAAALYFLGTVEGMSRPVVGGPFLGFAPKTIMMDLGSNVDCQPYQLVDFAVVGAVYAGKLLGIENPTVALLSVGAEEGKGNEQVKETYQLLKESGLNFIGNVEGYDIPTGKANVVICDGFVGNVIVKFTEALGQTIGDWLVAELKGKLPEAEITDMVGRLVLATNLADLGGGGPLWAVNGVVCVTHGRSRAPELAKTIGQAKTAVEEDLVGALTRELAAARGRSGQSDS
ncbi:MAG: phosphate acyltransferase PlsX [Dehalococcoidales bacterium]